MSGRTTAARRAITRTVSSTSIICPGRGVAMPLSLGSTSATSRSIPCINSFTTANTPTSPQAPAPTPSFLKADGQCPSQFTIGLGPGTVNVADNIYGIYAQDTWQFRRNITVNYGLRYDKEDGAFTGGTVPDPQVPGGCLQSNGLIPACGSDNANWQPRLGIAWSPSFENGIGHWLFGDPGKSVIRAAGGRITEMVDLNVVVNSRIFDGNTLFTQSITAGSIGSDGVTTGEQVLNDLSKPTECFSVGSFQAGGILRTSPPHIANT